MLTLSLAITFFVEGNKRSHVSLIDGFPPTSYLEDFLVVALDHGVLHLREEIVVLEPVVLMQRVANLDHVCRLCVLLEDVFDRLVSVLLLHRVLVEDVLDDVGELHLQNLLLNRVVASLNRSDRYCVVVARTFIVRAQKQLLAEE